MYIFLIFAKKRK